MKNRRDFTFKLRQYPRPQGADLPASGSDNRRTSRCMSPITACSLAILAALVFPVVFWCELFAHLTEGTPLFFVTWLGLGIYFAVLACTVLLLGLLVSVGQLSRRSRRVVLALALIPPLLLVVKWTPLFWINATVGQGGMNDWLALFHNRMGAGQEILGPIPNMFFDGLLFMATLAPLLAALGLHIPPPNPKAT